MLALHADGNLQHWVMMQHADLDLCGVVALANHAHHEIHESKVPIIAEMQRHLDGTGDDSYRLRPIISATPTTWKPDPRSREQGRNVAYLASTFGRALQSEGIRKSGVTRLFRTGAAVRAAAMG
jgi:hypothetical protein